MSGHANYTYGLTMPKIVRISKGGYMISLTPRSGGASGLYTLSALGSGTISVSGTIAVTAANSGIELAKSEELAVTIVYN